MQYSLSILCIIMLFVRTYHSKFSELTIKNPLIGNIFIERMIFLFGFSSIISALFHTKNINSYNEIIGSLIFISGIYLLHLTHYEMGSSFSPRIDKDPERKLVNTGIFSIVRHPMYSSIILMTIGIWFMTENVFIRFSWTIFCILLLSRIQTEEEYLTAHFKDYDLKMPKYRVIPSLL